MSGAFSSIDLDFIEKFHLFLISSIPGDTESTRIAWAKNEVQPLLINFFLANPLGLNFSSTPISQINITRLKALPENLRGILFSMQTPEIIKKISDQNNIPEEKLSGIANLIGSVLLGFIHGEELPEEISKKTGLSLSISKALFDSFNTRIFNPIQSDLDKLYAPLPNEEKIKNPIIENIAVKPAMPTPSIVKPTTLSDVGWSKMPAGTSASIPTPRPAVPASTFTPAPAPMSIPKPAVSATPSEPAPMMLHEDTTFKAPEKNAGFTLSKPGGSAEMTIDQKKTQAPLRPAVLEFGGAKSSASTSTTPTTGGMAAPKPPMPSVQTPQYGNFRTPLSSMPTVASAGPRNVTQITPTAPIAAPIRPSFASTAAPSTSIPTQASTPIQIPKPPAPPSAPKPIPATPSMTSIPTPRPPQAPQAPQTFQSSQTPKPQTQPPQQPNKAIVKDFL